METAILAPSFLDSRLSGNTTITISGPAKDAVQPRATGFVETSSGGVKTASSAVSADRKRKEDVITSRHGAWPRLVVRDSAGRTLDTFTTLQDAIYRASWTVKTLRQWPTTPLQWRLPKAPVPSRPDYSRATAQGVTSHRFDLARAFRKPAQNMPMADQPVLEIDVNDVSFVAESLRLLLQLPSFAFLRHSLLAGGKTYLHIVGSLLLHQRYLLQTEKRQAEYTFPGFCSGCRRAGFCYGCDKNSKPHVHEDVPVKIGGGFQFFKRDRPLNQHAYRDPRNWITGDVDLDLSNIIDSCGGLSIYRRAAMTAQGIMEAGQLTSHLPFLSSFSRVRLLNGPWPGQKNLFTTLEASEEKKSDHLAGEWDEDDVTKHIVTIPTEPACRKPTPKKEFPGDGDGDSTKSSLARNRSVTIATELVDEHLAVASEGAAEEEEESAGGGGGGSGSQEADYDSGFEGGGGGGSEQIPTSSRPTTLSPIHKLLLQRSRSKSKSSSSKSTGVAFGGSLRSSAHSIFDLETKTDVAESQKSRQETLENIPFARKREDVSYKAPSEYRPVKSHRRPIIARDPFSRDREYNIPQGGTFQLQSSSKKTTKFIKINRDDAGWKAPKKFELKHNEAQQARFWSRSHRGTKAKHRRTLDDDEEDEARRRRRMADSEDSGLDSDLRPASTTGGDQGLNKEIGDDVTGNEVGDCAEQKKRKEIVKKTRRSLSPPETKVQQLPPTPSPPPSPHQNIHSPTPTSTPPPATLEPPEELLPLTDISLPDLPELPVWKAQEKAERQKKPKFLVSPLQPPKSTREQEPKKKRPPPRLRRPLKLPLQRLKTKPAEAQVKPEQVHDMHDPLDWLAKYCIINPDRLPLYEMVFESVVSEQEPRYCRPQPPSLKGVLQETMDGKAGKGGGDEYQSEELELKKNQKGKKKKSEERKQTLSQVAMLEKGILQPKVGLSLPEQQLEKLSYTLDALHRRLRELSEELQALQDKKLKQMVDRGKELFPQVTSPDYVPKANKKRSKKSRSKEEPIVLVKLRPEDITDQIILSRLTDKMLSALRREPDVRQTDLELGRAREKIHDVSQRLQDLASEKLLTDAFCMNHYYARQGVNHWPGEFRRQQSELYNRLNPDPDFEMNLEEVEEALQQINGHLLTQKEFFFLYNVLNLPMRTSINFRLFSVVAALSEKVTQLDPVIRKLMNNTDYNALDIKMEKCRELFTFLEGDDSAPRGGATAELLAVELTAGGLTPEHTRFVLKKFNRDQRGVVDFLDFVTYIPLFILIHRRIISQPLREDLDF